MICPFCSQPTTQVTNSRPRKKSASVWRRRRCEDCQRIFSTSESVSLQDDIRVLTKQAAITGTSSAPYNRGVLLMSVASAFAHDPAKGRQTAWWITETIEASILTMANKTTQEGLKDAYTMHPGDISTLTHKVLDRYDQSAAIQYAARHGIALA